MPEHDLGRFEDIRACATEGLSFTAGMTFDEFVANAMAKRAVVQCLTVIGEAASKLSPDGRSAFPQFDWDAMKGMRNVLVHDYGRIMFDKVWDVVQSELPRLRDELQAYLSGIE